MHDQQGRVVGIEPEPSGLDGSGGPFDLKVIFNVGGGGGEDICFTVGAFIEGCEPGFGDQGTCEMVCFSFGGGGGGGGPPIGECNPTISGPAQVTVGEKVTFLLTDTANCDPRIAQWSGGGDPPQTTGSSFTTSWDKAGPQTVTVTVNGVSRFLQVIVAGCDPAISGPPSPIVAGDSVTYTAQTQGCMGVQWSAAPFACPSAGSGASFTTVFFQPGPGEINAHGMDSAGTETIRKVSLQVDACSLAILGDFAGLPGEPLCFAAVTNGSATGNYLWSAPGGSPAAGTSSTFCTVFPVPGPYTVSVSFEKPTSLNCTPFSCGSASQPVVILDPPPSVSINAAGPLTLGVGQSLTVMADGRDGLGNPTPGSYSWSSSDSSIVQVSGAGAQGQLTGVAAGAATVTVNFTTSAGMASASIGVNVIALDVDIDSNNDNGTGMPARDAAEESIEDDPGFPGKIMAANNNDDDDDGIPDYADLAVSSETSFVPLVIELQPPGLDWSAATLRFDYLGPATLPSPVQFAGDDVGGGFTNYTGVKTDDNRLWNIAGPSATRAAGDYIVPGMTYSLSSLGLGNNATTKTFYLEGINAADKHSISATLTLAGGQASDTVNVTVVEPDLGVNGNNSDPALRTGIPDRDFTIDAADDMIEDQGFGFQFWPSRDLSSSVTPLGVVDLMPMSIRVPASLQAAGFSCVLEVASPTSSAPDLDIYQNQGPLFGTGILGYIRNSTAGSNETMTSRVAHIDSTTTSWEFACQEQDLVVKFLTTGTYKLSLLIEEPDPSTHRVPTDSVVITIKSPRDFYYYGTMRGSLGGSFSYPTDDQSVTIQRFPPVSQIGIERLDPSRPDYLVFLHGFNVTHDQAVDWNNELFKRVYWTGYRDNYIGLTWFGDIGPDSMSFLQLTQFGGDVENALHSSPSLYEFLRGMPATFGADPSHINIMAHSLGNLVLWDALRINQKLNPGTKIVNNVISVEAAIWPEAFDPQQSQVYDDPNDELIAECTCNFYSVAELKKHSWKFWFRQSGAEAAASANAVFNSFVPDDSALDAMRTWDYTQRNTANLLKPFQHYLRTTVIAGASGARGPDSLNVVPTLMTKGQRRLDVPITGYPATALNLPLGTQSFPVNPLVVSDENATVGFMWEARNHSALKVQPLYEIFPWYQGFLKPALEIP